MFEVRDLLLLELQEPGLGRFSGFTVVSGILFSNLQESLELSHGVLALPAHLVLLLCSFISNPKHVLETIYLKHETVSADFIGIGRTRVLQAQLRSNDLLHHALHIRSWVMREFLGGEIPQLGKALLKLHQFIIYRGFDVLRWTTSRQGILNDVLEFIHFTIPLVMQRRLGSKGRILRILVIFVVGIAVFACSRGTVQCPLVLSSRSNGCYGLLDNTQSPFKRRQALVHSRANQVINATIKEPAAVKELFIFARRDNVVPVADVVIFIDQLSNRRMHGSNRTLGRSGRSLGLSVEIQFGDIQCGRNWSPSWAGAWCFAPGLGWYVSFFFRWLRRRFRGLRWWTRSDHSLNTDVRIIVKLLHNSIQLILIR